VVLTSGKPPTNLLNETNMAKNKPKKTSFTPTCHFMYLEIFHLEEQFLAGLRSSFGGMVFGDGRKMDPVKLHFLLGGSQ